MRGLGVAVAGAVLAAGLAGGSAFAAVPQFPNHVRHHNHVPANIRRCENLARHIGDLERKKSTAKNQHQADNIQRQIDRERARFVKVCGF